jgi:N-acetylmuramoyl-L-alanine amidase
MALCYKLGTGLKPRAANGILSEWYYVLRATKMPAVLIELGFLTSPVDSALLREPAFLDKAALSIAMALETFKGE